MLFACLPTLLMGSLSTLLLKQSFVGRISYVYMEVAPVNNKSGGLWVSQEIGGRTSRRKKEFGDTASQEIHLERCEEMHTQYLSAGKQTRGKM